MNTGTVMAAIVLVAGAGALRAADPPQRPAAIVTELTGCRSEADPARRLACYDAAAAKLETATAKRDVVIVDREEIKQTRRSLFGFALPRVALFGGRGPNDEKTAEREDISELDTTVTRVQELGYGKYQVVLAEGGTWRSTEAWTGAKLPEAGAKIRVKRAALGSYTLKLEGGRAVRGMRVG